MDTNHPATAGPNAKKGIHLMISISGFSGSAAFNDLRHLGGGAIPGLGTRC